MMIERYWEAFKNIFIISVFLLSVYLIADRFENTRIPLLNADRDLSEIHHSYIQQGTEMIREEKYDQGIDLYEKAIASDPDDSISYFCMANAYRLKNEPAYAVEYYKKALHLQPDDALSYYHLGLSYASMNKMVEAVKMYDVLKKKNSKLAEKLKNRIDI